MAHVCLVNAIPQNDESRGRPFGRCAEMVFWKEFRKRQGTGAKGAATAYARGGRAGLAEVLGRVSGAHLGDR